MLLTDYKWVCASPRPEAQTDLPPLIIRRLGLQDYLPIFNCMQYLAEHPKPNRDDEIWLLSHKPVYTQGQAGKAEHVLDPDQVPVVQVDRGGQVTFHGPGQLVAYLMINVRRRKLGARALVTLIERAIIATLAAYGVQGETRPGAPGVYVNNAKIGALGLRIKNGLSYHGLSLNVDMDLSPFAKINPCGYKDLAVCQLADFVTDTDALMQRVSRELGNHLVEELGYLAIYPDSSP